jgi:hypothetical protein
VLHLVVKTTMQVASWAFLSGTQKTPLFYYTFQYLLLHDHKYINQTFPTIPLTNEKHSHANQNKIKITGLKSHSEEEEEHKMKLIHHRKRTLAQRYFHLHSTLSSTKRGKWCPTAQSWCWEHAKTSSNLFIWFKNFSPFTTATTNSKTGKSG